MAFKLWYFLRNDPQVSYSHALLLKILSETLHD